MDVNDFLNLRILVVALGEGTSDGWWKSQFLSPIGLRFLERVYPRSTFAAAVNSASRAARSVHDGAIGRGAVFHLFRLPPQIEREIDAILLERSGELSVRYKPLLSDRTALLSSLEQLAVGHASKAEVGPLRLAGPADARVGTMAAAYLGAFRAGKQAFPYFE